MNMAFMPSSSKEVAPETQKYDSWEIGLLVEKVESREIGTTGSSKNGWGWDHQKIFLNGNKEHNKNKLKEETQTILLHIFFIGAL